MVPIQRAIINAIMLSRMTTSLIRSFWGRTKSFRKKDKKPNAATMGVIIRGLIIQNFPHSGLGSSTENTRTEIMAKPITAPVSILLIIEIVVICGIEKFLSVISDSLR